MSVQATSAATRAMEAVVTALTDAGIAATRDPGAFYPQPVGVLVAGPALTGRGHATRTFALPVLVVSGDPLNSELAVDRLYALADDVALALACDSYRPSSWRSPVNAEPLPALELPITITETEVP
jgi:hypothetical protein